MIKSSVFKAFAVLAVLALVVPAHASEGKKMVSTYEVGGMTCGGCSAKVRLSVKELDGVADVKVSHDDGRATVTYNPDKVTTEKIEKTIKDLGYKVKLQKTEKAA